MRKILLYILLIVTSNIVAQNNSPLIKKEDITEAVKAALKNNNLDYPERIAQAIIDKIKDKKTFTEAELAEIIVKVQKVAKEVGDSEDYTIKTNEVFKSEFDTVLVLKPNRIYQLKVETEGNYYVVKYIDLDKKLINFQQIQQAYSQLERRPAESKESFITRKTAALKIKNDANPYKVCYLPLDPDAPVTTAISDAFSLNLATVPFKIFPKTKYSPSQVNGDIDNVGLYIASRFWNLSEFDADGEETKKSFSFGLYIAPSVVKLDESNTGITGLKEVNKLYLTTALAISYKYGNFTLMLIPAGVDTALSDSGKMWRYAGHYWWGFGLGIDTDFFNF